MSAISGQFSVFEADRNGQGTSTYFSQMSMSSSSSKSTDRKTSSNSFSVSQRGGSSTREVTGKTPKSLPDKEAITTFKVKEEPRSPGPANSPPRSSSRLKNNGSGSSKSKSRHSSSSSESSVEVKKVKLDPDFTPLKYEALKGDLKIVESRLKQAQIVNKRLNENLKASEESNLALQAKLEKVKKQLKEISPGMVKIQCLKIFVCYLC